MSQVEWIRAADRLPEINEPVIVCMVDIPWHCRVRLGRRIDQYNWRINHIDVDTVTGDSVEAWAPLPDPPEDEARGRIDTDGSARDSDILTDTVKNEISFRASQSGLSVVYGCEIFNGKTRCTFSRTTDSEGLSVCYGLQECYSWLAGYEARDDSVKDPGARELIERLSDRLYNVESKLDYHGLDGNTG